MQASVSKGSIRLADNGARLASRLTQLHDDIERQSELVQMHAEQLTPSIEPAMHQHQLPHGAATNGSHSLQFKSGGQQLQHLAVNESAVTQFEMQQHDANRSQHNAAPQRVAGSAGVAKTEARPTLSGSTQAGSRHITADTRARPSADRNQHDRRSHDRHARGAGSNGRGRSVPIKQAAHAADARKTRLSQAPDKRYSQTIAGSVAPCRSASALIEIA